MIPKLNLDDLRADSEGAPTKLERREFLKLGFVITGVLGGSTVLSLVSNLGGALASGSAPGAGEYKYSPHYSMVIRQSLCIDCELCIEACITTNNVPSYGYRTRILEHRDEKAIGRKREFIPVLCNQCNNPPCIRACPTRATYKDKVTGIVMMEYRKCIGCKTCMLACPYNARYFNYDKRAVDKCNFCYDTRLSKGETLTACASVCPTGARTFGILSDPTSKVYRMVHQLETTVYVQRPSAGTEPNVFYMKV